MEWGGAVFVTPLLIPPVYLLSQSLFEDPVRPCSSGVHRDGSKNFPKGAESGLGGISVTRR